MNDLDEPFLHTSPSNNDDPDSLLHSGGSKLRLQAELAGEAGQLLPAGDILLGVCVQLRDLLQPSAQAGHPREAPAALQQLPVQAPEYYHR